VLVAKDFALPSQPYAVHHYCGFQSCLVIELCLRRLAQCCAYARTTMYVFKPTRPPIFLLHLWGK
jgi:hypothetical protein